VSTTVLERPEEIVARWRTGAADSPAGPLFIGGRYAEAELIEPARLETQQPCSACTASRTVFCC
jgi:hypothetical protein